MKEGADSVMTGFNALNNVPISGNKKYLRDILRGKFGFNGIVISDAGSINEMIPYGVCENIKECNEKAIEAGVDIDLGALAYPNGLEQSVKEGRIAESLIDDAVLRVLEKKYELGLFEDPYCKKDKSSVFSLKHLKISEELASESAVLLENGGELPVKKGSKIAVIGRFAKSKDFLGCWQNSAHTDDLTTLCDAFTKIGCEVTGCCDTYGKAEVDRAILTADTVIFTCGETSEENGEAHSKHNLHLKTEETDCFSEIKNSGKNIISLVFAGRPLIINELDFGAVVYCWDLGHKTAEAVVDLLTGKRNFSGKLAATIPLSEGQLPVYYAKKKLGRPFDPTNTEWRFQAKYEDGANFPKYVFGYGKSYSNFKYGKLVLSADEMKNGGKITASIDIINDSDVDGTEIVQMYIGDAVSEVLRPIKELKDFKRVFIKAHEKARVEFNITEEKLSYYHENGELKADNGKFTVYVGKDSNAEEKAEFRLDG